MQTVKNIKVVVFGDKSIGKTTFLNACLSELGSEYEYNKNFELMSTMTVKIADNNSSDVEYNLELWDTKSVESYKIIEEMKNCEFSIALICYSVMDIKSFEDVKKKVKIKISFLKQLN